MAWFRRLAAAAAVLAPLGCGDAAPGGGAAPVDTARVGMVPHYRFEPATIRVSAGETVVWSNEDDFTHAVQIDTAGAETHRAEPGDSVRLTFTAPGEYDYVCTFHRHQMRGRVIVEDRVTR